MASALSTGVAISRPVSCYARFLYTSRYHCVSCSSVRSFVRCKQHGIGVSGNRPHHWTILAKVGISGGGGTRNTERCLHKSARKPKKLVRRVEVVSGSLLSGSFSKEAKNDEKSGNDKPERFSDERTVNDQTRAPRKKWIGRAVQGLEPGPNCVMGPYERVKTAEVYLNCEISNDVEVELNHKEKNNVIISLFDEPVKYRSMGRRVSSARSGRSSFEIIRRSFNSNSDTESPTITYNGSESEGTKPSSTIETNDEERGEEKSQVILESVTNIERHKKELLVSSHIQTNKMSHHLNGQQAVTPTFVTGLESNSFAKETLVDSKVHDILSKLRSENSSMGIGRDMAWNLQQPIDSRDSLLFGKSRRRHTEVKCVSLKSKRRKDFGGRKLVGDGKVKRRLQDTEVLSHQMFRGGVVENKISGCSLTYASSARGGPLEGYMFHEGSGSLGLDEWVEDEDQADMEARGISRGGGSIEDSFEKSGAEVKKRVTRTRKTSVDSGAMEKSAPKDIKDSNQAVMPIGHISRKTETERWYEDVHLFDSKIGVRLHVKDEAGWSGSRFPAPLEKETSDSADGSVFLARTTIQSITDDRALVPAVDCVGVDSHELIGLKKWSTNGDVIFMLKNDGVVFNSEAICNEAKIPEGKDVGTFLGSRLEEAKTTVKLQFPAPNWGPQWWEMIQLRSQVTISFQDVAWKNEGSDTQSPAELKNPGGVSSENPAKQKETRRSHEDEAGFLLNTPHEGGIGSYWHGTPDKSGKRGVQPCVTQSSKTECHEEWLNEKLRQTLSLTEEPWILEAMLSAQPKQVQCLHKQEGFEGPGVLESSMDGCSRIDSPGMGFRGSKKEPDMEVEILINSSECTMQRMAILEDKKLVEFSIEPVNTKVQVGNVYLGRVKQLLPGMSGLFVDIGGPRLALLDIARNQYPYTFPPVWVSERQLDSLNYELFAQGGDLDLHEGKEETDLCNKETSHRNEVNGDVQDHKQWESPEDGRQRNLPTSWSPLEQRNPITVNFGRKFSKWRKVEEGMPMIVQVKKESMGKKGPRLTAFPTLAGRFWVLVPRGSTVGVSARITGPERRRLKLIAQALQPQELGITVRTEAVGHAQEELEKDLNRLMETWKEIMEKAAAAALAVNKGEEAAVPVLLHREMGQTLTIIRDFFTEKVSRLVVDSSQSYQEVISYLQEVAPHLISRVVLYSGKVPIFDMFNVEEGLERLSNERVKLPNGGYLVMQETEALVSIDVNGGMGMLGHSTKQRKAILEVNLAAARQIASEIRLRDIGGIIVVDFIDMDNAVDEKLVHEEMWKAIQRDRSKVTISEISEFGLMEMTRKRVRPSVTWTINDSCSTCKGTGRVEALETTLSKIERAIRRFLAVCPERERVNFGANKWPQVLLCIEPTMLDYLKSWKKKRIIQLSNSLKVWISLKVGMDLSPGQFKVLEVIKTVPEKDIVGPPSGSQSNSQQQQQQLSSVSTLHKQGSAKPHLF